MTDSQRMFALAARAAISEFFANPENEREYQKWLREREAGAHTATNDQRATHAKCPPRGTAATV